MRITKQIYVIFIVLLIGFIVMSCNQENIKATEQILTDTPDKKQVEAIEPQKALDNQENQNKTQPPQVCAENISPPTAFGAFEPAQIQFNEPGFAAEMFVAPGEFNMPQEVFISPDNDVLVYEVRGHALSRIEKDGTISLITKDLWGYQGDMDELGNIFLHMAPTGMVTRVTPEGEKTTVVHTPDLQSACDSGFGIGPDGNLYVALSRCTTDGDVYRITPTGEYSFVSKVTQTQAFQTDDQGRFLAATRYAIYEVSLENFNYELLRKIPGGISPGGLTTDNEGNIYISTGSRSNRGKVFKLDVNGTITTLAEISENGLSGIEWQPATKEVIGGQLRQGGILAVGQDGSTREIVSGNGIVTPMGIGFSPCGDLVVPNDDGGMMSLVSTGGEISWLMDYISFIPPIPFVAFDMDANLYASEGAPGFEGKLITLKPGNDTPSKLKSFEYPSGLALGKNNELFIAETGAGNIIKINLATKETTKFIEGLNFPQALAFDQKGYLYVVTGPDRFSPDQNVQPAPMFGDKIEKISPSGEVTPFANIQNVKAIAFSPDGDLFATVGGLGTGSDAVLIRFSNDGQQTKFAYGFEGVSGLTFDLTGNLYIADDVSNSIIRIGGFSAGTLSLTILDASGDAVPNVRVQIYSETPTLIGQIVFSDSDGKVLLHAAPRLYSAVISAEGYKELITENIQINADQNYSLELKLEDN